MEEKKMEEDEDVSQLPTGKGGPFDAESTASGDADRNSGDLMSLRELLDDPKRTEDTSERLHIFRQVVELVSVAHSQAVVVNNIRPSCFALSNCNRVSLIESAYCSNYSREREDKGDAGAAAGGDLLASPKMMEGRRKFRLKTIMSLESGWYASPEEVEGKQSTFASDVYKLGVLLFELVCKFETEEEKLCKMCSLRDRVLPPQMLLESPKKASFCLWLLHPQPSSRPTIRELLQSEFLNEEVDHFKDREAAIKLKEETEELELFLDFLLQLQTRKEEAVDKLQDTISFLSSDIDVVEKRRSNLIKNGRSLLRFENRDHKFERPLLLNDMNEGSSSSGSRKRIRSRIKGFTAEKLGENHQEALESKSSRIMKNFKILEEAYVSSRCQHISGGSTVKTPGSSANYLESMKSHEDSVNPFIESLCKYLSFSRIRVLAEVNQGDLINSSNLICCLDFDRDKEFFASAGVNRKIKVFGCDAILKGDCDVHYPVVEMASKSKLSSVCWNGYIKNQIASSDFEGVVQVWDVAHTKSLVEMREHEKRVWSVHYSMADPTKLASGSDDCTVKLWSINQAIAFLHLAEEALGLLKRRRMYALFNLGQILLACWPLDRQIIMCITMIFGMCGRLC